MAGLSKAGPVRRTARGLLRLARQSRLDPLPLRHSLRGYRVRDLGGDGRAALNVALLAFPQGMAYSVIAGLPIVYGITCSAFAAMLAPWFASSRHTVLGPTNATAFMVFSFFAAYPALDKLSLMPLVVLLTGVMLVAGAFLRVADLVQYISRSVIIGYLAGAAVLIIANQLAPLLGVEVATADGEAVSATFFTILADLFRHLGTIDLASVVLALVTGVLYWGLRRRFARLPVFAIVLVFLTMTCALLNRLFGLEWDNFADQSFDWRSLLPPAPNLGEPRVLEKLSQIFGLSLAIAFLASLENSVMAKTLASRSGDRSDANQDMLALGVVNTAGSWLSGMPASGSLTRSMLNFASGAVSPLASLISGLLCLVGALTLGPYVGLVPRPVLATLVVAVALGLVQRRQIRICLFATKSDATVLITTFCATLLMPLHVAIFVGVGVSIALYLRQASRPHLVEYEFNEEGNLAEAERGAGRQNPSISIVHVEGALFFGAADLFRTQIQRICTDPNLRIIILRLKNAHHLDATSVMALEELIGVMRANGRDIIISGAMKEVYRVLKNSRLVQFIGRENIFPGSTRNPNLSTRNALKRAVEILGGQKADIHIYFDPGKQKQGRKE